MLAASNLVLAKRRHQQEDSVNILQMEKTVSGETVDLEPEVRMCKITFSNQLKG